MAPQRGVKTPLPPAVGSTALGSTPRPTPRAASDTSTKASGASREKRLRRDLPGEP